MTRELSFSPQEMARIDAARRREEERMSAADLARRLRASVKIATKRS